MVSNKTVVFDSIPKHEPVDSLKVVTQQFDLDRQLAHGEAILKVEMLSLDPYMRSRMRDPSIETYVPPFTLGEPIDNGGVVTVLKSNNAHFKVDRKYYAGFTLPFSEYALVTEASNAFYTDITDADLPIETLIGACGLPGKTAYHSYKQLVRGKAGEKIFISAASGAIGQMLCQLCKMDGLKVLAAVGSDEKVDYCEKTLGVDRAFNYKKSDTRKELAAFGCDIFYDNVGGKMLEDVLDQINVYGRVICCGQIATYNSGAEAYGIKNTFQIVAKRLSFQGFITFELIPQKPFHESKYNTIEEEFMATIPSMIKEGKLDVKNHVYNGIEATSQAFLDLLRGDKHGKTVIQL
ncbi:hypothetical protein E3P86_00130 [Wallemia ichthyophaga]|uniref:Enoyl reductase (ER) domain-containing protein n=1 Tax=Wallemia ichthyophaga TaxID=245174 RepID=A0A4T0JKF0_WALIC|nr:hypothetical protein E3P86_00130 [Wallemia ichthyophaga]